jgi:hypothetical protein
LHENTKVKVSIFRDPIFYFPNCRLQKKVERIAKPIRLICQAMGGLVELPIFISGVKINLVKLSIDDVFRKRGEKYFHSFFTEGY